MPSMAGVSYAAPLRVSFKPPEQCLVSTGAQWPLGKGSYGFSIFCCAFLLRTVRRNKMVQKRDFGKRQHVAALVRSMTSPGLTVRHVILRSMCDLRTERYTLFNKGGSVALGAILAYERATRIFSDGRAL